MQFREWRKRHYWKTAPLSNKAVCRLYVSWNVGLNRSYSNAYSYTHTQSNEYVWTRITGITQMQTRKGEWSFCAFALVLYIPLRWGETFCSTPPQFKLNLIWCQPPLSSRQNFDSHGACVPYHASVCIAAYEINCAKPVQSVIFLINVQPHNPHYLEENFRHKIFLLTR